MAFQIVKLKYFCLIQHPWNGPFLGVFGPLLPQLLFSLAEILTRGCVQYEKDSV